ncbi:hypothetical protein SAMN04488018_10562 [Myroides marinus]|uniref:Uncharacterized protein n=1 Tax=Myroides marinus TaxID=703342 RepID=A0A1H6TQM4_9FLAO|nr:hypothetical protein [Myroides marinus]SEI81556.1 hypothetical protein SAMN04488018_10562 [Myroides marinus]
MAITKGDTTLRSVSGISAIEEQRILDFLQGAVYCWCKNRKDEWFSLRELMGGDNFYWEETPLMPLYEKHRIAGSSDPVKSAGKDCGWMLKKVIINDSRNFETDKFEMTRKYKWI